MIKTMRGLRSNNTTSRTKHHATLKSSHPPVHTHLEVALCHVDRDPPDDGKEVPQQLRLKLIHILLRQRIVKVTPQVREPNAARSRE